MGAFFRVLLGPVHAWHAWRCEVESRCCVCKRIWGLYRGQFKCSVQAVGLRPILEIPNMPDQCVTCLLQDCQVPVIVCPDCRSEIETGQKVPVPTLRGPCCHGVGRTSARKCLSHGEFRRASGCGDLHTPALKPAEKRKVGAGGAATCERLLQAPDNPGSGSVRSGRCCRAGGEAQRQRLGCLQLGVCPVRLSCIGMRPSIRAKRLRNDSSWEACLWQSMQLWQLGRTKIAEVMHCRQGKVQKRRMLKLSICSRL